MTWALRLADSALVKPTKSALQHAHLLSKAAKISSPAQGTFLLPLDVPADMAQAEVAARLAPVLPDHHSTLDVVSIDSPEASGQSLKDVLPAIFARVLLHGDAAYSHDARLAALVAQLDVPTRYQVYEPLVLFTAGALTKSAAWQTLLADYPRFAAQVFAQLLAALSGAAHSATLTHVAENAPIVDETDILRLPSRIRPLHPADSAAFAGLWVHATQNGIRQTWSPLHTMFSRGNIKEKARVLAFAKATAQQLSPVRPVAVDMYAGIGYFTFSYAKAGFAAVFCWELNPWSVKGLLKGAALNHWAGRQVTADEKMELTNTPPEILVFNEDNVLAYERLAASFAPQTLPIAHINLGLLPSTNLAWPTAVAIALFSSLPQVHLHVHANLAPEEMEPWCTATQTALQALAKDSTVHFEHLEKIKTYAPGVWHVCGDFAISNLI